MAIVVTGATGQLGALVVQHLLERGTRPHDVLAAGRDRARLAGLPKGVKHAAVEFEAPHTLDELLSRGDTLLFVSSPTPGAARTVQHRNVVEAAVRNRVGRIVYTSIARADSVDTVLTPDHRATEEAIAATGIPYSFLRNNLYMEVAAPKVVQASARNEVTAAWGDGRIAGVARGDLAEAAAIVLAGGAHEDPVYELSGSTSFGGEQVAVVAQELLGKPITWAELTSDELDIELAMNDVPEAGRNFQVQLDGDVREHRFEPTGHVLEGLLGRPQTTLIDAIRAALPADLPQAAPTAADAAHGGPAA